MEKKGTVIQSVQRAIDILMLFKSRPNLRITDIANEMGLAKSTVHGLVNTLEQNNFLQQDPSTASYSLGIGLFEFGILFAGRIDIRREAHPVMERLVEEFSETAQLGRLLGNEVIYLDVAEGPSSLKFATGVGTRSKANYSAIGKVMLADLPEKDLDNLFENRELPIKTPRSIASLSALKEHLKLVRAQGYSIDDEEFEIGVRAVAVGIRNHTGKVVAAMSLGGPATRIAYDDIPKYVSALTQATQVISARLGFSPNG